LKQYASDATALIAFAMSLESQERLKPETVSLREKLYALGIA
jgi:hypothetical protein